MKYFVEFIRTRFYNALYAKLLINYFNYAWLICKSSIIVERNYYPFYACLS